MVKSRRARKALPATTYCYTPPPVHAQDTPEGVTAAPMVAEGLPTSDRPPSRSPGYRRVRDQLGKLTRLGSVLNYSDEQSSNNGEDDDIEPNSSSSEMPCLSRPSSSSPDPGHQAPSATHPEISDSADSTAPIVVTDLQETLARSASASDAALAFQRWRISSLKVLFTQDLNKALAEAQQNEARLLALEEDIAKKEKHLVHALADSAQLRAQLCALESVNGLHHESPDMEALQMDLVKALQRATSSEAEVERYNKEIRKLRERLKSAEDEASRLDSELKATVSFLQKEKHGVAKENQVLLEQLARKDEEVLSQTLEINSLKSVLACLRVSRLELERLKNELQGTSVQRMKTATHETMGNGVLQSQMELKFDSFKASADVEEQSLPSGPVLSQLLDVLQKLTVCLHKNEAQLEPSVGKIARSEEKHAVRSDSPQKGTMSLEDAADSKPIDCAGQVSSSLQLMNGAPKGLQSCSSTSDNFKGKKLFAVVTCWKWRWVAAASGLQALSKEISTLKSVSKDEPKSVQQSSFISCLDNFRVSLINQDLKNTQEPSVDLQAPVSFDKVFALLTSIWKLSSQSAHQEMEAFHKSKQLDHLLRIMTRWMQRALKKRQLERVITHWLRYLLRSWKDKFKLHYNAALHLTQGSGQIPHPKYVSNSVPHIKNLSSSPKARNAENSLIMTTKGPQNSRKDQALQTLQESLHHRLEALEASIMNDASHWHQQHLGDGERESMPTNLVWKLCCELERCFSEARNQIMTYFGVLNNLSLCNNTEKKSIASAFSSKSLAQIKVGSSKKPVERHSSVQAIARKRKQIFI